jgi:hypothetical protein
VHVARWEKEKRFVQCFSGGGDRERERQLGKPRHRWEYDIKMDLKYRMGARTVFDWLRIRIDVCLQ